MAQEGDFISIRKGDFVKEGILVPSHDEKKIVIKLESGYNMVFKKTNDTKIDVIKKGSVKKETAKKQVKQPKCTKNISILHCGGTVASKVDYKTGGVTAQFDPSELLSLFPEIGKMANISSRLVRQMMSENMRFGHYNIIAKAVNEEIKKGADGIIVTQGTDTLHYSTAALAFILENLPIPVIFLGSQRSSDRGSSDAAINLISAVTFICQSDFSEVALCMHKNSEDEKCSILPACKTRKMHTSRRDAFRTINTKPWAEVIYKEKKINFFKTDYKKTGKERKLELKLFNEKIKIALIKTHTHMFAEQFSCYKDYDGIVIEGTGLGQIPNTIVDDLTKESGKIIKAVKDIAKNKIVILTSQCIYGRVDMNVYTEGRVNLEAGLLGNYCDMTPETAFIKLAWLLSNYAKEEAKQLIAKNLRGEISERTEEGSFLI